MPGVDPEKPDRRQALLADGERLLFAFDDGTDLRRSARRGRGRPPGSRGATLNSGTGGTLASLRRQSGGKTFTRTKSIQPPRGSANSKADIDVMARGKPEQGVEVEGDAADLLARDRLGRDAALRQVLAMRRVQVRPVVVVEAREQEVGGGGSRQRCHIASRVA